eukprot:m.378084 g.378084  ORF g.378084 m.378084 type:complete len:232 (-) comp28211_c3_seq8:3054-3749(-)
MHACCVALLKAWAALSEYRAQLVRGGFGPPRSDGPDPTDSDDASDSSSEEDSATATNDDFEYLTYTDGAQRGAGDAPNAKQTWALHLAFGITSCNWGIASILVVLLEPYKIAVVHLQTSGQPISHRAHREIQRVLDAVDRRWLNPGIELDPASARLNPAAPGPDPSTDLDQDVYGQWRNHHIRLTSQGGACKAVQAGSCTGAGRAGVEVGQPAGGVDTSSVWTVHGFLQDV